MSDKTKISWTDATWSPVTGCTKVSPGCQHCYAADYDKRVGGVPGSRKAQGVARLRWGKGAPRTRTSAAYWRQPLKWDRDAEKSGIRRKVFCGSLCDVFDAEVSEGDRVDLLELIHDTPHLTWLLLTKRAEQLARHPAFGAERNVWLGVTVENQEQAEKRIPLLLAQECALRFLSCEPLLEDLGEIDFRGIGWVIVGSESGPHARPMDEGWVRSIRDQCVSGAPLFYKQRLDGRRMDSMPELDGRTWRQFPYSLKSRDGAVECRRKRVRRG